MNAKPFRRGLLGFLSPILAFLAAIHGMARAADPAPGPGNHRSAAERAQRLVEQLGHPKFAQREAAARSLIALGLPAFGPLKDAARHADPEVRYRADKVFAEVRQRDFQRRLEAFAENAETSEEYELPGWREFRQLVGDSSETRTLFVQMQSDEPRLMQALEDGPRAAGEALSDRCLQLFQPTVGGFGGAPPGASLGSATAILFLSAREEIPLTDFSAGGVYQACMDQAMHDALDEGPHQAALRTLLSAWIARDNTANMEFQKLMLAMQYELKAGLAPAVQILEQPGHPPHLRQQAMVAVAKFGDASHIPLLERYLEDESPNGTRHINREKTVETQLRDVALAALVAVTRQDFADYGMEHVTPAPPLAFSPYTCGFESPEARKKALEKWRAYRAKQTEKESDAK